MKQFEFNLISNEDVILVDAILDDKYKLRLAVDIAATHTTIDSSVLYFSKYDLKNKLGEIDIETSNGIIVADVFCIKKLECISLIKTNVEVQVYDFVAHGIFSEYDGVLGLDFLKDNKFCIDIPNQIISIDS